MKRKYENERDTTDPSRGLLPPCPKAPNSHSMTECLLKVPSLPYTSVQFGGNMTPTCFGIFRYAANLR